MLHISAWKGCILKILFLHYSIVAILNVEYIHSLPKGEQSLFDVLHSAGIKGQSFSVLGFFQRQVLVLSGPCYELACSCGVFE
jgi:hypothetical protein